MAHYGRRTGAWIESNLLSNRKKDPRPVQWVLTKYYLGNTVWIHLELLGCVAAHVAHDCFGQSDET